MLLALVLAALVACGGPGAEPVDYKPGLDACAATCPGASVSLARKPDERIWCFCKCPTNVTMISFPLDELPDETGLDKSFWQVFKNQYCGP